MKYPTNQFENLVSIMKQLSIYFDLNSMNKNSLHYLAYQQSQSSDGQKHNVIYFKDNQLKKLHSIDNIEGWKPIVKKVEGFELYPNECNDNHIETAIKNALKLI